MSIGLNRSYQYVGLNRFGAYLETAREKGPERADRSVGATIADKNVGATIADKNVCATTTGRNVCATIADRNVCATKGRRNEIWRRYTGIFPGVELTPKQRRRGLRILARRIRERVKRKFTAETQRRGERRVSLVEEWDFESDSWTRAETFGISVEQVCEELGCRRHVLTALMKEHCGMSASEFLDGVKISRVRAGLIERLKLAASELWGCPGSYALVKVCAAFDTTPRREDAKARRGKESKYFRSRFEEMFEESRAEERARRIDELCEMLRGGTGGQATSGTRDTRDTRGTRGTRFELESWAVSCGYESAGKLKRACLNVFGKTLAQVERMLASEVVQFYLCAEDRELREIALRDDGSVEVARAREIYHGDDAKPVAPFEDEWAKFEELKAEWLARMWTEFG